MKKLLVLLLVLAAGIGTKTIAQDENYQARQQLHSFKLKDKLKPESGEVNFRGLSKPELQPKLNSLLNVAADDFLRILNDGATDKRFQEVIAIGLSRFNPYYENLDTEDRTRICNYFEELMDDVGLESSGGAINKWMYGFDPAVKQ
ncbi:DUF4844 domain-containing protein [Mucilaginibacter sp. AK015]|uniref:DUF4844 domain-containing protein n=1 Tax=Mucilaginibacter sp. AK015 TaxID=2723072 RepID=UPI001614711F|nr:DUF4844 domain-containing protein [Mucilaginibacter sp. AK015]MBB5393981.1 hypothetical protein [Mucilaginibacter sp. AK015]